MTQWAAFSRRAGDMVKRGSSSPFVTIVTATLSFSLRDGAGSAEPGCINIQMGWSLKLMAFFYVRHHLSDKIHAGTYKHTLVFTRVCPYILIPQQ